MTSAFDLPEHPGTYALWLRSRRSGAVVVGRLGLLSLRPGVYVYVGSAFGPGGLRARVGRHLRVKKAKRWHVDHLRPHTSLEAVHYCDAPAEHEWAQVLARSPGAEIPLPRFGASDCRCPSHLFFFARARDAERGLR